MDKIRHILIADDSESKLDSIRAAAKRLFPDAAVSTFSCANPLLYQLCWKEAEQVREDPAAYLVLTDKCMPFLAGGRVEPGAGEHVLAEMARRRFACPAIVISSGYVDDEAMEAEYPGYAGSIEYDPCVSLYHQLKRLLESAGILNEEKEGDGNE